MVEFTGLDDEKKEKVIAHADRLREEDRLDVLSQALVDRAGHIRKMAAETIGEKRYEELLPAVFRLARDHHDLVRSRAMEQILALPEDAFRPLIERELGSCVFSLRIAALDLLSQRGSLDDLELILPVLFDHKIDCREAARKAMKSIVQRYLASAEEEMEQSGEYTLSHEGHDSFYRAIDLFFRLVGFPDRTVASEAAGLLIDFGYLNPRRFWEGYRDLPLRCRESILPQLAKREGPQVLNLLLQGLLFEDQSIAERCARLAYRLSNRRGITDYLKAMERYPDDVLASLARQMQQYGLIGEILNRFSLVPSGRRGMVFDLLENLDCRPHLKFLESCLSHEDDLVIFRAVKLLVPLSDRNYVDQFVSVLSREDPDILLLILDYMQKRADVRTVPKLTPLLAHSDERVTRATLATIFTLSRQHLLLRYDDLSTFARQEIVNLLKRLDAQFVDLLCEDINRMATREKIHLVNILELVGEDSRIDNALARLAQEPDNRVRATVARALRMFGEARKRLELTRSFLDDDDSRVRANAIESLESVDDETVLNKLMRLTRSPNSRERANSIKKLWEKGYQDFEISLMQMLEEPDEWTRSSAVWVLGEINALHLVHLIEEKLGDQSAVVRENAVKALGKRGTEEQVRNLTEYLNDPDTRVRQAARDVMRQRLRLAYEVD